MKNKFLQIGIISQVFALLTLYITRDLILYLNPVVIVVVWFCVSALIFIIGLMIYKLKINIEYNTFKVLLVIYTIGLIVLLFFRPHNQIYNDINLIPFSTISNFLKGEIRLLIIFYNLAANIALFIPYGIFLMIKKEIFSTSNIFLAISPVIIILSIETLQYITKRGIFDIDDIILNLFGIVVGCIIYNPLKKFIKINVA
jgi:glycopeptide antibiotics resistance protein